MHHHDGTGGLYTTLLLSLMDHTLPVALLDALLHDQFVVEIVVLIPIVPDHSHHRHHQCALGYPSVKGFL